MMRREAAGSSAEQLATANANVATVAEQLAGQLGAEVESPLNSVKNLAQLLSGVKNEKIG